MVAHAAVHKGDAAAGHPRRPGLWFLGLGGLLLAGGVAIMVTSRRRKDKILEGHEA